MSVQTASAPAPAPANTPSQERRSFIDTVVRAREVSLIGVLAVLVLAVSLAEPRFLNAQNLRDILLNVTIVGLLAVGQTIVVVTRNIDLSVGSVLGITAFSTGVLFADHNMPIVLVFILGVLFGAFFGLINGAMVAFAKVPSLVITLGTLYVIRGIDYAWAHGRQINAADMPDGFLHLGTAEIAGIPVLPLFTIAAMLVVGTVLGRARMGRELYAIGSNPDAANLAGIRTTRRVLGAFVASGAIAGLAGVLYAARYGTLDAAAGNGIELAAVSAVVVGGVAIFGGAGTVYGAALGALLLGTIRSALVILQVNPFWEQAINGALLLLAIGLDAFLAHRLARELRKRASHRV
ncbi:ABC transporter permease [Solirubrobacter soli]|uniref:ABC transporter permease n=1 Tax=Solirubrobacter soli TaxID=363832 RepID=UPI0003F7EF06|nr:ABC transporter permease [Solirubrobacter soli]